MSNRPLTLLVLLIAILTGVYLSKGIAKPAPKKG